MGRKQPKTCVWVSAVGRERNFAKVSDCFPLLKLDRMIDWQPIEQYLNRQRTRYLRDHRGRPAYPLLSMFKAVLLGQWHSLSDPELEHSLITRIDFNLLCRFDELSIPDYSTLCRYRNWLAQDNTLSELLKLINRQLTEKGLKVEKASAAVVDATIIQTAGSKQRQAIEVDEEGQISGQTTPSKDSDARWIKKNGLYKLGYKQHTRTDVEGYIEKLYITPTNAHECTHLSPLLEGLPKGTTVYADKGYDSAENRQHLEEHQLQDGIMRKSLPQTVRCRKRKPNATGICRRPVAMCLNLLKAANRLSAPAAAQKATGCLIIGYLGRIKGVFG
ncbi:transposase DDE domain protein [Neisseria meningitidis 69096]|nr:transposase DDE domain protein [Neisseria meningitidis 69096]